MENNLKNTLLKNDAIRAEFQQILNAATQNNIKEKWISILRKTIAKKPFSEIICPRNSFRRKLAKKIRSILTGKGA